MNGKTIHVKPGMYTLFFEHLKIIAERLGYNLVLHGSLHRDLDLIAIPWIDNPASEIKLVQEFEEYLSGRYTENPDIGKLPGGRNSYVICLNRGDKRGEWTRFDDEQYYLDLSITPLIK